MNRAEFFMRLRQELRSLPPEELEDAISYYVEYFDDAGAENEQAVIQELGPPERIASQIKADLAVKKLDTAPVTAKKGLSTIWLVVLAILASPIALPLAIAAVSIVFALVIAVISVILAFYILLLALLLSGVGVIVLGCIILAQDPLTSAFFIGSGIALIGISILFGTLAIFITRKLFSGIAILFHRILHRKGGKKDA